MTLLMGGNFNYLAPELFDGEPADFRSDMFSLGVTAFHMVTGHLPYDTTDPARIMKQVRTAPLPDPGKLVKNLPRHLGEFILKACEKDPDQRFQTPDAARQWLADRTAAASGNRASPTPARAVHTLVRLALDARGTDNITVVVTQKKPLLKG